MIEGWRLPIKMEHYGKRLTALILILALLAGMFSGAVAEGESDFLKKMLALSNNETYKTTVSQRNTAVKYNSGSYVYKEGTDGSEVFKAVEVVDEDTAQFYFGAKRVKVPQNILYIGTSCSWHGNTLDIIAETLNLLSYYGPVTYHLESWPGFYDEKNEQGQSTFREVSMLKGVKPMDSADWSAKDLNDQPGNHYIHAFQRHLTKPENITDWIDKYLDGQKWDYIVLNADGILDKELLMHYTQISGTDYREELKGVGTAMKNFQKALQTAQKNGTGIIVLTEAGEVNDIDIEDPDKEMKTIQVSAENWQSGTPQEHRQADMSLGYVFTTDLQNETNIEWVNRGDGENGQFLKVLDDLTYYKLWIYKIHTKNVLNAMAITDYSSIPAIRNTLRSNIDEEYDLVIDGLSDVTWLTEDHLNTLKFFYYDETDGWKEATKGTDYKCSFDSTNKQLKVTTIASSQVIHSHDTFYVTVQSELRGEGVDGQVVETNTECTIGGVEIESPTILLKHFKVEYETTEDPKYGKPNGETLPDDAIYLPDAKVTVADDLTTTQEYAIDSTSGKPVPGEWSFVSWDKDNFIITEDTTIKGAWKFTPDEYTLTYNVLGDDTYGLPTDNVTPDKKSNIPYDGSVDPLAPIPTTVTTYAEIEDPANPGSKIQVPGTWSFVNNGWSSDTTLSDTITKVEGIKEDKNVYGQWKFTPGTYKVTYTVDADTTWGIPEDSVTPIDPNQYGYKEKVEVEDDLTSTQKYAKDPTTGEQTPGTWTFTPWNPGEDFEITENTTIRGGWTFTPAGKVKVTYVTDEDPVYGKPDDEVLPEPEECYPGDSITVKPNLTTTQGTAKDPQTGKKIQGTWVFTPWDHQGTIKVTGNTEIRGAWSFIPVKTGALKITKTVEGSGAEKDLNFTFTVTFSEQGSFACTGAFTGTISSGDSIKLADGESVTIEGVPEGTRYCVTEEKVYGYEMRSTGADGVIVSGKTQNAEFINTKIMYPPTGDPVDPLLLLGMMLLAGIGICFALKKKQA